MVERIVVMVEGNDLSGGGIFSGLLSGIDSIMDRDPAARSRWEVVLCYPSFHAVIFYRVAHFLWVRDWHLLGRFFSQFGRWLTGIEIHPGAVIGKNLFIDHGMGVVIGEASIIGDNVTLYHGVTLGGVSPSLDSSSQRSQKRHPTICDYVIIGSGAQVLGPVVVGRCARVGSNAVVIKDVAEKTSVVGIPARAISCKQEEESSFSPYGMPKDGWQDPSSKQSQALLEHMHRLELRIKELENRCSGGDDGIISTEQDSGEVGSVDKE